ncbi:hypothetical protein Glove_100g29 [Diversispora epigaea]|uniref:Uncharacterized protein n=1 Tax=Diversispora epigaea TaxID=1348612 RepID=A0A397JDG8_9GLOM|nr:hypothetical protein Glove_100g29 [Diversispora epigaea]
MDGDKPSTNPVAQEIEVHLFKVILTMDGDKPSTNPVAQEIEGKAEVIKKNLKHVTPVEKNPLPTQEDIEQEKKNENESK